ncbi:hypothetical protein QR685DRAFT_595451 [Neurospora intermedia]|uniref:Uncharacterized protein n=1 Tax=Neurospora intermedia TaxID=5142 RepID=A0ABR3DM92_NEUIN
MKLTGNQPTPYPPTNSSVLSIPRGACSVGTLSSPDHRKVSERPMWRHSALRGGVDTEPRLSDGLEDDVKS